MQIFGKQGQNLVTKIYAKTPIGTRNGSSSKSQQPINQYFPFCDWLTISAFSQRAKEETQTPANQMLAPQNYLILKELFLFESALRGGEWVLIIS